MKHSVLRSAFPLAVYAATLGSLCAYAEEQPIASDESGRVTIDTESVQPSGAYVQAGFWAYSGQQKVAVIAMIEGCDQGRGRIQYKADPNNPGTPMKVGLWKAGGEQITDKMASAACERAKGG
jgi:hypothetical protein